MRRDRERLLDISEAIERIEKHTRQGREPFDRDELVQTWVVHNLQIIGEAARALSPELRGQYPQIPWAKIGAMRNILVHSYFDTDLALVWSVVEKDLQPLKREISNILRSLP